MLSGVNNSTAFSVFTEYTQNSGELKESMARLSKGVKGVKEAGAQVAISERMRGQTSGTEAARQNVQNGLSLLQTADSWMQKMGDQLNRMHELAVSAQDGTKTDTDKTNLNKEFQELQDEITRMIDEAEFNGQKLFDGNMSAINTQVGAGSGQTIELDIEQLSGISGTDGAMASVMSNDTVSVATGGAISAISSVVTAMGNQRATIGGQMSRLENTNSGLLSYEDNLRSAESQIRDVDAARESTEMAQKQILTQTSNAMLSQANQLPAGITQLVG